ncbi:CGNR zinc finger domain-containing protein [Kribbella hippodromi]|uniref:CGNR zinc finger domain-containing protein n=1 Tax=Kribbella hippodromi TaxID=434347 RepID=A0ABN2DXX2_9ACTN
MEIQSPDRLVRLAVDLVNTRTLDPEQLISPASLRTFLLEHGEPEPVDVNDHDLTAVRAIRERLRPVFQAQLQTDAHAGTRAAAGVLNGLLAEYAVKPYLSDHDGAPWHLHVAEPDASWAEWLAATTALGLATFVAGHGFGALGVCAAVDCERVFANPAERRPRRFCTPRCATRTRVAAHRSRNS